MIANNSVKSCITTMVEESMNAFDLRTKRRKGKIKVGVSCGDEPELTTFNDRILSFCMIYCGL